ncbi:sialin-like [Hydractinia symbiolongicarpus]|uniref:sialin-like n=1 Tax=Hydractinia symbiolongicarpus TaxID=13093 RepID=UPI00254A0FA5|nr:sialin-like [Hydractinia symbiolongicarpus]
MTSPVVDNRNEEETKDVPKDMGFPKRYVLALMVFLGFCVLYALRVNLNVAIGAMCNNHTIYENGFYVNKVAEFEWDSKMQGMVLGSFYYGYIVLQIPGGWLATKIGGTRIFGMALFLASILTLLTPAAARYSVYALITLRVLEGVFLGVLFPSNHAIWGQWAPPNERSRLFSITAAGCPVGTILTMPLTGLLTKYGFDGGWASVFYVFGAVGLLWFFVWCLIVHPSPETHTTISDEERNYIMKSLDQKKNEKPPKVPWLKIITSIPVWATIVANFTADWGLYTILICIPKFFQKVLKFDIATTGFLVSLPYLIKAIVGPSGGIIADMLIEKGNLSVRNVRRLIFTVGCTTASVFIVGVGYAKTKEVAIALLCAGVGITGLNATGYAVNILDIAPRFAGVIIGFSNVFGSMPGFISPMIVGYITTKNTAAEWQLVFWITAFVYAIGVIFFALTVSGKTQPWNDLKTENPDAESGEAEQNGNTENDNVDNKSADTKKSPDQPKKTPQETKKEPEQKQAPATEDKSSPKQPSKEASPSGSPKEDRKTEDKDTQDGAKDKDEPEKKPVSPRDEEKPDGEEQKTE